MKVWNDYGSEHSANLIMIGRFKDVETAEEAKKIIDQIEKQVSADIEANRIVVGELARRYTEGIQSLLGQLKVYSISPTELEQFAYDVQVELKGETIVVKTDEMEVSAFLKVLIDNGARVEVYSAHDYPVDEKSGK
jgi:hypothetical protein